MRSLRKKSSKKALKAIVCKAMALREREVVAKALDAVKQMDLPSLGREEAERLADAAIRAAQSKDLPTTGSARPLPQSSRIDSQVETAMEACFKQLRREAQDRAYERLYGLNARGVEWHRATRGLVYLADERKGMLRSLERAAVNTNSGRQDLPILGSGIVSRVYSRGKGELDPGSEGKSSGSVLVAPIYAPTNMKKLGVYLLEADRPDAFTPAQVRELHRQVVFFTPQLFVLEALNKDDDYSTWPFHPEVHCHGWSPEPLLTRFCRTVAESLRIPDGLKPACTFWTADREKKRCWVLAAYGYDYSFLDCDTLGTNSAVARVARNRQRAVEWGTPAELVFACPQKAQEMGVRQVIIASLHDYGEEPFSGTLNISFFEHRRQHTLPSRGLVEWLAERGERLVTSLNAQRIRLAQAYLHCELAKEASSGHGFGALLRTALRCLAAPVGSVFARPPNTRSLQCVETTGFENQGDFRNVTYDLDHPQRLTCWAARNPGQVVRLNWGPVEEGVTRPKDQPEPSNESRERMVPEGSYRRRSLIAGVGLLQDDPDPDPLGAIRVLRPGKSPPFTSADERLLAKLAETSKKVYTNWAFTRHDMVGVQNFISPHARIEEVAQGCVSVCAAHGFPIVRASVFVHHEGCMPEYRLYTSQYPQNRGVREELDVREERIPKPTPDQILAPMPEQRGKIIVLKSVPLGDDFGDDRGMRICVPILVWSGGQLVEALLALDFKGTGLTWPSDRKLKVFYDARKLPAFWASNPDWRPDADVLEQNPREIVRDYLNFLCVKDSMIRGTQLRLLSRDQVHEIDNVGAILESLSETALYPDPELQRFGVRLATDASYCVIPLLLGPFWAGEMVCGLHRDLANALTKCLPSDGSEAFRPPVDDACDRESEAFQKLRDVTVRVTGPWCRLIAGNLLLWDVDFGDDREEEDKVVWNENISLKPELLRRPVPVSTEQVFGLHV